MTQQEILEKYGEVRDANSSWLKSILHAEATNNISKTQIKKIELSLGALVILEDPDFQTPENEWFLQEMEIVRRDALIAKDVNRYREETNLAIQVAFDSPG